MKSKTIIYILTIIILGAILFSTFKENDNEIKHQPKIAFIVMKEGGTRWGSIRNGARTARSETNVTIEFYSPVIDSPSLQIDYIKEAIKQEVDCIIIAPSDSKALNKELLKAQEKGIKILIVYNTIEDKSKLKKNHFMSDYNEIGNKIGLKAISLVGKEPINAFIIGSGENQSSRIQLNTSITGVLANSESASVHSTYYTGDKIEAKEKISKAFNNNPSINLLISLDETSSAAALEFLEQSKKNITFICTGNSLENVRGLEKGTVSTMLMINSFAIGYRGIYAAIELINNKKIEDEAVDYAIVTKENLFDEDIQRIVFPL